MKDIRTETACADGDGITFVLTKSARKLKQFESLFESDAAHAQVLRNLSELRLLGVFGRTYLYHWTETTDLNVYWSSALRIKSELTLTGLMFLAGIDGALYCRLEVLVESLKHLLPLLGTLGNLIEVLLYLSGEVIVHDFLEILH